MNPLVIQSTEDTPNITLNKDDQKFEISGRSSPQDAKTFYQPALDWLNLYKNAPNSETNFVFKLEYFNDKSSKPIIDLLSILELIDSASVSWYFHEDDEDMEESGTEFSELVEVPFDFKTY